MTTLAEITRMVVKELAEIWTGSATSGSATTMIDTALSEPDDYFNGGTLWLITGNNAGKTAVITDWANTTHTATFATLTLLCAAGDQYQIARAEYNRQLLRTAVNSALSDIGKTMDSDSTLVGDSSVTEYTLPSGVSDVRRIVVEDDVNYWWDERDGKIVFDDLYKPSDDDEIVLHYAKPHSELTTDAGTINAAIDIEHLKWCSVAEALYMRQIVHGLGEAERENWKLKVAIVEKKKLDTMGRMTILMPLDMHAPGEW